MTNRVYTTYLIVLKIRKVQSKFKNAINVLHKNPTKLKRYDRLLPLQDEIELFFSVQIKTWKSFVNICRVNHFFRYKHLK